MTRPRAGVLRQVSVIVLCRYSPATARIPKTSVKIEVRPTCASALLCAAVSSGSSRETTRPLTPAITSRGEAARRSHGLRTVRSFSTSVRIRGCMSFVLAFSVGRTPRWLLRRRHRGLP